VGKVVVVGLDQLPMGAWELLEQQTLAVVLVVLMAVPVIVVERQGDRVL
jgi:hypothetical protein|tara:strand:+ start:793 stop:939 length:147 start_codon:yes stop_codon:yes gene_type:complete